MNLNLYKKGLKGCISLSASKSINNRVLILNALCNNAIRIIHPATSDDSAVMREILEDFNPSAAHLQKFNVRMAGTAMRFLTAYFASIPCHVLLTGDERMKQRPIAPLVNALKDLGANIEYVEKDEFPPLLIKGEHLKGGEINIEGSISSQFISALLLIACTLKEGLSITYTLPLVSASYVEMTLKILRYFGIESTHSGNCITVNHQPIKPKEITIEGDWSSASYLYLSALLAREANFIIKGLTRQNWQGDAAVARLFEAFGISTTYFDDGILIKKLNFYSKPHVFYYDFTNCPDLVQTLAVAVSCLKLKGHFKGIKTLRDKETNRVDALKIELQKLNVSVLEYDHEFIIDASAFKLPEKELIINTYHDHRMALAFAPLAFIKKELIIDNPMVVNKSYPEFWQHLNILTHD